MARITIRDVARHAGVSVSAVSQVLHDKGRLSQDTRDRVNKSIEALGYIPDSRAQSMRSSVSHTIGLLVPDLRNEYFSGLAYSVQNELFNAGFATMIGSSLEDVDRQDAFLRSLAAQRIDGMMLVPQAESHESIDRLMDQRIPAVFVDRRLEGVSNIPFVGSDPQPGIELAVSYLMSHGNKKIGFVSGPVHLSSTLAKREKVFEQIARETAGSKNYMIECTQSAVDSPLEGLNRMKAAGVTAVIFGYSPNTVSAIAGFHEQGIMLDDSFDVVSFDDISVFKLAEKHISIISQQVPTMGQTAVKMLLRMLSGDKVTGDSVLIATQFIAR